MSIFFDDPLASRNGQPVDGGPGKVSQKPATNTLFPPPAKPESREDELKRKRRELEARRSTIVPPTVPTLPERTYKPIVPATPPVIAPAPVRDRKRENRNADIATGVLGLLSAFVPGAAGGAAVGALRDGSAQVNDAEADDDMTKWKTDTGMGAETYKNEVERINREASTQKELRESDEQKDIFRLKQYEQQRGAYTDTLGGLDKEEEGILKELAGLEKAKPTDSDLLSERTKVIELLHGLDDATQSEVMGLLDSSGDYERLFGTKPEKDAAGKYTLAIRAAPPVKAPVDPAIEAQKRGDAANKDRYTRLRSEVTQLGAEYRDDHTSEPRRRAIEARLKQIKTLAPQAWNGSVPAPGSRQTFTPQQQVSNANAEENQRLAKEREKRAARNAAKSAAQKAGTGLTVEQATSAGLIPALKSAKGVDLTYAPPRAFDVLEGSQFIASSLIPNGRRDANGEPESDSGSLVESFRVAGSGYLSSEPNTYYLDFDLPEGSEKTQYEILARGLQRIPAVRDSGGQNKAFVMPGRALPNGRGQTGGRVRVVFRSSVAPALVPAKKNVGATAPIKKGSPANLQNRVSPVIPRPSPSPQIMKTWSID